jgi:hypothetical protein
MTRTLALLLAALLWSGAARADLDDIKRAAEGGDAEAQLELGILFQYGFNYKDNEIPALTWYMLSANQGSAKAGQLRDALKAKMTEQDVREAMEQVSQYKPTAPQPAPAPVAPEAAPPAPAPTSEPAPTPAPAPAAPAESVPMPEFAPPPAEPAAAPPPAASAPVPDTAPPAQ